MESIPVLDSLLALSLATLDSHAVADGRDQGNLQADPNESGLNVLYSLLIFAFESVRRYVITPPTSWQSPFRSVAFPALNSALFQEQYPTVSLSVSWLILRLGKSRSPPSIHPLINKQM